MTRSYVIQLDCFEEVFLRPPDGDLCYGYGFYSGCVLVHHLVGCLRLHCAVHSDHVVHEEDAALLVVHLDRAVAFVHVVFDRLLER